jgi:hypothetical protein
MARAVSPYPVFDEWAHFAANASVGSVHAWTAALLAGNAPPPPWDHAAATEPNPDSTATLAWLRATPVAVLELRRLRARGHGVCTAVVAQLAHAFEAAAAVSLGLDVSCALHADFPLLRTLLLAPTPMLLEAPGAFLMGCAGEGGDNSLLAAEHVRAV